MCYNFPYSHQVFDASTSLAELEAVTWLLSTYLKLSCIDYCGDLYGISKKICNSTYSFMHLTFHMPVGDMQLSNSGIESHFF